MDLLNLQKAFELNLEKAQFPVIPVMETRLAIDCSGSMDDEFRCGWVDHLIARFFVAAMKFDDNAELDVGGFNTDFHDFPSIKALPEKGYTSTYGMRAGGGTSFAPVLKEMATNKSGAITSFLGKLAGAKTSKAYLGMLTDGANDDREAFEKALANVDGTKTFLHLIAIGTGVDIGYLRSIQAAYPFVHLSHFIKPHQVDDNAFYQDLCNDKFKAWIEANK